ncbi:MAG: sulfurtransferase, partial [Candidatus Rokubacteria bacterium]|nr:sulfurtransferase [Candidatus Rokubacteria bacterium]
GRPGRIPGSVNAPFVALMGPKSSVFRPPGALREMFERVGATPDRRVMAYGGGSSAATADAFALTLLGHERVSVYDTFLWEWCADPALPMETG